MAASKRTFYETLVTIWVLSEQSIPLTTEEDLHAMDRAIADGEVTAWWKKRTTPMTGPQFTARLLKEKMDPASYGLTEEGEDENEEPL